MKKIIFICLLGFIGFACAEEKCDLRENNKKEWDLENMRIQYSIGATIQQLIEDYPEYSYDEIYFIVEDPEKK